jgi:hypothetical protein
MHIPYVQIKFTVAEAPEKSRITHHVGVEQLEAEG